MEHRKTIVITSMYANPIHPGHVECLELAKQLGDELWVIVNNDRQAYLKRGVDSFQDQDFRMKILSSVKPVDHVFLSIDTDETVCQSIRTLYEFICSRQEGAKVIFAKGGDRFADEIPEKRVCQELGIKIVDGLGKKTHNSSDYYTRNEESKRSGI